MLSLLWGIVTVTFANWRRHGSRSVLAGPRLAGSDRGELAIALRSVRSNLVFGRSRAFEPWVGSGAMMQSYASAAKLRAAGPFYSSGTRAMGGSGTPPPRIVIGHPAPTSETRAETVKFACCSLSPQIAACSRIPAATSPVVASRHNMISSLRASATIMVFRVLRRPSWVRWRNH